jgi:hypothetical protein
MKADKLGVVLDVGQYFLISRSVYQCLGTNGAEVSEVCIAE